MAAVSLNAATTMTFRNGVNGYSSAADLAITNQYAEYNGGNGVLMKGSQTVGCYNTSGNGAYSARYLLKFANLNIPAGSQVGSASLTLSIESYTGGNNLTGFYLLNAWNPAAANLGWIHRDASTDWAGPGASSAGTDTVAGKTFQVPQLNSSGAQTITVPLDPAVVQSWINNPSANQGIMLVNNATEQIARPFTVLAATNLRPLLTVNLLSIPVSVSVAPQTATLAPGGQQTFAATVTGTSNTAVTWTATGGTISSAGVYQAGNTAGTFTVQATSVADSTKSATATVTIKPTISVSVAPATASVQTGQTQQFAATVTGSSNTSVTWTATGGTITQTGLYTAGAAPGTFQITAKSAADASKVATAAVTVTPAVAVTVAPASAALQSGQTKQFTATVTGNSNTAVTWTATGGTISSSGLYTAGSTNGSFQVKATSVADPTKSATAAVTITAPVMITVAPTSASLQTGQAKSFTAAVTGATNTAVTWTATGGTITSAGLYTAGSGNGTFEVKATSVADPTKSATAAVTITAPVTVTVAPTSASLQTGQTKQFTATVTGNSNTALTWTATGGTISSSGLYAAGSTTGTFEVKATSVADPTKSATAAVTITSPVTVTVAPTTASLQSGQTKQFTTTVTGATNTAVTWTATGGAITSAGLYTAGQTTGTFAVTAKSVADPTKSATASVDISSASGLPPVPRQSDGAYVVIQSPAYGMHFTAPGTIRIYADPYVINAPDQDAHTVTFMMNGQTVGTYTGSAAQNGYYAITVNNLAAGPYVITARINAPNGTVTSAPVTVFVDNAPATTGQVHNLTADVVLSGSQAMTYSGTPANHCVINGNGFQIRSAAGFNGSLKISNCDVRNLGSAAKRSIDVAVQGAGSIELSGNIFDTYGGLALSAVDQSQMIVRGNEFRENVLVPVGSQPEDVGTQTVPVILMSGSSSANKFFQGNNVGLSTVVFDNTRNWLIGGNTDAESNVLMGVRCGFRISGSTNMVLRGNFSQHNYPHRFSQGENFQLNGDGFLVEHNIIRSSSWPVRGMGGELRYNLIDSSGNSDQVLQGPMSNTKIHHNLFIATVSQTLYSPGAGVNVGYQVDNVQFYNNVMDGGGNFMGFYGTPVSVLDGAYIGSLRNNVFYNYPLLTSGPVIGGSLGESTNTSTQRLRYADYNAFFNPDAPNQSNYGLGVVGRTPGSAGFGLHDAGGYNGHLNPKFTTPTAIPFPFKPEDIWNRVKKVSDVLSTYRTMYTPASGSPLINTGDPQDGANRNIGVVGNGEPTDLFGKFGTGAAIPNAPVIVSFTATQTTINAGQSVTLNWSVTGADTLNIDPTPGPVTGTSVQVTPGSTTTYTLTAANAGGATSAAVTVTVIGGQVISVSVAPSSASVPVNTARQFTATVTGATNPAVTWTATGGTVSATGLFTAGTTTGAFTVTVRSVQDPSKLATASVNITPQQPVAVSVAPSSALVFPNGTQQFTATVANATNSAVIWSASGGQISPTGLYTAGASIGNFTVTATSVQDPTKSGTATVSIVAQTSSAHPRMVLDTATLATLRAKAQANTPEWIALKAMCDSYIGGGTIQFPDGAAYPNRPSVGEGYQGSGYIEALMPLGLCYQTVKTSNTTLAAQYGAKGVAILMAMSDPSHSSVGGTFIWRRDFGYGIRNYGAGMGLGYDWFYDALSETQKTQIQTALTNWISSFENDSFEYDHPQGNYFAGYYAAKCYAALAVQGDNPVGDTWWNDWYSKQHLQRVAPYYAANMTGGGWTEGFSQYGILGSINHSLPTLAVWTAKGLDIIHAPQPYTFPLDQARYLMHFTWPSRDMMDDRGELYNTGDVNIWPGTPPVHIYRFFAGFLAAWNDPAAPMMHKYARDVKTALTAVGEGSSVEWVDFLFWTENASETPDYSSLPASYLAPGIGGVAARSDWSTNAAYMTFLSAPYINNPAAGHEHFDKGSLAIQRNRNPLVVNAPAWITHEPNGSPGWTVTFNDRFWDPDRTQGNRTLYNTFQVRRLNGSGSVTDKFGQWAMQRSDGTRTTVSRFEDKGTYVLTVGQYLEDMYRPFETICAGVSPVTQWSRQILYVRPSQFIVYDRTGVCDSSLDQYMAFHFSGNPVEVAAPAPGVRRFDVTTGVFAGSMTTLLPANPGITTTGQIGPDPVVWNKMWRSEIRATGAASATRQWLNVFDVSPSSAQVATAKPVTITSGAAVGALLASSSGNTAAVFGTAPVGTPIAGVLAYATPAAQTRHIVTDLAPSTGYTVTVTVAGSNHNVAITQGGSMMTSSNGVLTFTVTAGGAATLK